jgi:2-polyprenyl-6-hydroxyphenyl methylase/3-demethylubiquinone-9 3-methyltransferase
LNPVRLSWIRRTAEAHFCLQTGLAEPFKGMRLLDAGCGGGLVSEPLARLGADVTAIDASADTITAAALHARAGGLAIDYRATTIEALRAEGAPPFDMVISLEVVEHVADPRAFLIDCAALVRPGGLMIISTLNKTARSLAEAVIGAEYILRWLPAGTHDWSKFLAPDFVAGALRAGGLSPSEPTGLTYHPLTAKWTTGSNVSVNYMLAASRPA